MAPGPSSHLMTSTTPAAADCTSSFLKPNLQPAVQPLPRRCEVGLTTASMKMIILRRVRACTGLTIIMGNRLGDMKSCPETAYDPLCVLMRQEMVAHADQIVPAASEHR